MTVRLPPPRTGSRRAGTAWPLPDRPSPLHRRNRLPVQTADAARHVRRISRHQRSLCKTGGGSGERLPPRPRGLPAAVRRGVGATRRNAPHRWQATRAARKASARNERAPDREHAGQRLFREGWRVQGSNLRRHQPTDLQSAPFGHSGNPPGCPRVAATGITIADGEGCSATRFAGVGGGVGERWGSQVGSGAPHYCGAVGGVSSRIRRGWRRRSPQPRGTEGGARQLWAAVRRGRPRPLGVSRRGVGPWAVVVKRAESAVWLCRSRGWWGGLDTLGDRVSGGCGALGFRAGCGCGCPSSGRVRGRSHRKRC